MKLNKTTRNPEKQIKDLMDKKEQNLFLMCERCGKIYEETKNLPIRCDKCGACLLCEN